MTPDPRGARDAHGPLPGQHPRLDALPGVRTRARDVRFWEGRVALADRGSPDLLIGARSPIQAGRAARVRRSSCRSGGVPERVKARWRFEHASPCGGPGGAGCQTVRSSQSRNSAAVKIGKRSRRRAVLFCSWRSLRFPAVPFVARSTPRAPGPVGRGASTRPWTSSASRRGRRTRCGRRPRPTAGARVLPVLPAVVTQVDLPHDPGLGGMVPVLGGEPDAQAALAGQAVDVREALHPDLDDPGGAGSRAEGPRVAGRTRPATGGCP